MESKINWSLQDMPQLVIAKIMSLLNHKQLLMLEQVSKKLKCAVEDHFQTTDHLILGSLPSVYHLADYKKLLTLIQRCGIRLRTIQFNVNVNKQFIGEEMLEIDFLRSYIDDLFQSGGELISKTCPNIERIITSPKMDRKSNYSYGQAVGLSLAESYANHLYKMGNKCKLRAIDIGFGDEEIAEKKFKAIVDHHPHLQHILLSHCNNEPFLRYLPQFIENGLKDLEIDDYWIDLQDAEEYCKIGINLRTLRFPVRVASNDDIASINQIKLPKGLELEIVETNISSLALLNENVCDSVVKMVCQAGDTSDCSSMIKLKNLREFKGDRLEHAKLIAKQSFPKLKQVDLYDLRMIRCKPCREAVTLGYRNSVCESICLQKLLTSKGHQFTVIGMHVCSSLDLVVKAVKCCKAALNVHLDSALILDPYTTSITIEDILAILQLPRLQKFEITQKVKDSTDINDLKLKMENAENRQTYFKFEYDEISLFHCQRRYTFERIEMSLQ